MSVAEPPASLPTLSWLSEPLPQCKSAPTARYGGFTPLGHGGKAEVFRCRDQWLGREVAYKVLHHRLQLSDADVADFLREARVLAGLEHPGIPAVHDIGRDCHGRPYFTQTLLAGTTLRSIVDEVRTGGMVAEQRWPLERLAAIVLGAADAIAYAHQRGVLHCDLKPDNIIVDDNDTAFVIDWGIAYVPAELVRQRGLAAPGAPTPRPPRRGSPLYMAPEQATLAPLGERTDVFGLGAVLYECLALRPPATGKCVKDVLQNIAESMPPLPRNSTGRRGISPELEMLTMRSLARVPAERPASADEFRELLRECQLDLLVSADHPASAGAAYSSAPSTSAADWWEMQATDSWPAPE